MTRIYAQFWAPYRAKVTVSEALRPGDSAEAIARRIVALAVATYAAQWPRSPGRPRIVCVDLWDDRRSLTAAELRAALERSR